MDGVSVAHILDMCKKFKTMARRRELFSKELSPGLNPDLIFDLVKNLERMFSQLEAELKSDSAIFLPEMNNVEGEARHLLDDVNDCLSSISNRSYDGARYFLNRLVNYQMMYGFWNQHSIKKFDTLEKEAKQLFNSSTNVYEGVKRLMDELEYTKEKLSNISSSVEKNSSDAAKTISKMSSEAAVQLSNIESIYSSAKVYSEEVPKIVSESSFVLANLRSNLQEEEKIISEMNDKRVEILKVSKEAQEKVDSTLKDFSEKLESAVLAKKDVEDAVCVIKEKEEYFNERNKYLDDLIGREVGSSLFETFKQRKNEISGSIAFWKWSVLLVTIATILWVFFLFGNKDVSAMSWQLVLINTIKSIPVVGLLLFTISQYTKERNFQEEYAFKSAVALTINSYANQLDDKANKDRLVMESVSTIYRSPVDQGAAKISSKEVSSVIKDLSDTVKSMRS